MNILLVDDEKEFCDELAIFLKKFDYNIKTCNSGKEALEYLKECEVDLVISDVTMPKITGIELCNEIKKNNIDCEMILMSGKEDIINSINAMELGIIDFLIKPFDINDLSEIIKSVIEKKNFKKNKVKNILVEDVNLLPNDKIFYLKNYNFPEYFQFHNENFIDIGIFSEKMIAIYNRIRKLQEYPDIPILISGETGTGKEVIAKYVHYSHTKNSGPFIGINCSNFNENLFELELFGYEKGSFTGALSSGKEGKIELANNGTLFLDEISEIPINVQAKLLRVIQEREFYRIGGNTSIKTNARLICASNKNIKKLIEKKLFRKDLYYRLNLCEINIPPLKERKEEIIPLVFLFIKNLNISMKKNITGIECGALKKILDYSWQGNIRQLKNFITKLILFSEECIIRTKYINLNENKRIIKTNILDFEVPLHAFDLEEAVKNIIKKTMIKFNGNKSKTANYLGLTRIQLYRRYKV